MHPPYSPGRAAAIAAALILGALSARADVTLPSIFGDHMVLQQEATLPVWGKADPGEKVTVTFGGKSEQATTGADGKWRADLPALPDGTAAGTLTIAGKNTVTIQDVLVGDVWLCSGQSNMEFPLSSAHNSKEAIPQATDSRIRLFHVPHQLALAPRYNVPAKWEVCSPETVRSFTAVGYFFAKDLRADLKRPVGLIESSWGGTPVQSWIDLPTFETHPAFNRFGALFKKDTSMYPAGDADFEPKATAYDAALADWANAAGQAKAARQPLPPKPRGLAAGPGTPTILFNGMIAPLIPFPIKGVIWYQGEANGNNTADATEYANLFPAMITDWRFLWHEGDFPFLFVQLANFSRPGVDWPHLRESQLKTLTLPKTGMAVIIDIGTAGNIHPPDKADVGLRLALAARHVAYGENIVYTGPIYDSMKVEGDKIRVSFKPDSIGGGLIIGKAPWVDPKDTPVSTTDLAGFQISGADQKWSDAQAKIDGNSVVISSPDVPNPVAVRYGWAQDPRCNLYNKQELPASPFRTDAWDQPPAAAK